MSEPLCTEQIGTECTPNDLLEVEDVTNAIEKAESTTKYKLRHRPGRNVQASNRIIILFVTFYGQVVFCVL